MTPAEQAALEIIRAAIAHGATIAVDKEGQVGVWRSTVDEFAAAACDALFPAAERAGIPDEMMRQAIRELAFREGQAWVYTDELSPDRPVVERWIILGQFPMKPRRAVGSC
jgi:hypothetical protein